MDLNETHDPAAVSWVESAQAPVTPFAIQNLPHAVFRVDGADWRGGVAIGDRVVDLRAVCESGVLGAESEPALVAAAAGSLNGFMALGPTAWSQVRRCLFLALRTDAPASIRKAMKACLVPQSEVEYGVPARIGDYTDFYTSIHHASKVGKLFRPDQPLLDNYRWVPIGYHGRASSIGVSGADVRRPRGQVKTNGEPSLSLSVKLDFELELGLYIGAGNPLGTRIPMTEAESHIFGVSLLNDWSARDIQAWEYQPLGPFLGKNFGTTVSPWIVTLEALAPFRCAFDRGDEEPEPLDYLKHPEGTARAAVDIHLQVALQTKKMRANGSGFDVISESNYSRDAYWTMAQLVAHHTVSGCNLRPGDLLGTGTLSGPRSEQGGALIELTHGGQHPIRLRSGELRGYLLDGDTVRLTGWCKRDGFARIGFGDCTATVLPACY